jgi:hypothetical protein
MVSADYDHDNIIMELTKALEKLLHPWMQPIPNGEFHWVVDSDIMPIALASFNGLPAIVVPSDKIQNIAHNQLDGVPVSLVHNQNGPDLEPGGWTFIVVNE